jgi:WD40 repeat protein
VPVAAGPSPPLPDVPGAQGQLLDFVDDLKKKSGATAPAPMATAAATVALETQPPPPAFLRRKEKRGWFGAAKGTPPAAGSPAAAPAKPATAEAAAPVEAPKGRELAPVPLRRVPRPRPVGRRVPTWVRPLVVKLAIGVGVASVAVAVQDRFPHFDGRPSASSPVAGAPAAVALIGTLKGHQGAVSQVAYSDDGKLMVSAGADATLRVWDAAGGWLTRTIPLEEGAATAVAVLGHRALTGHSGGRLVLWDLDQATRLARFQRSDASIGSVTFAGTPDRFAASANDLKTTLWDRKTQATPMHVFEGTEAAGQAVAYSEHGPYLAAAGGDKTVKLWSLETFEVERTLKGFKDDITALAFSRDGRYLAAADGVGTIRVFTASSGRLHRLLAGHGEGVSGLSFSPAGDLLASAGNDGVVRVWDLRRGRLARALASHSGVVKALSFSPDGGRLASAGDDGAVRVWDGKFARRE